MILQKLLEEKKEALSKPNIRQKLHVVGLREGTLYRLSAVEIY